MDTIIIVVLFALIIEAIQNVIGHKVSLIEEKSLLNRLGCVQNIPYPKRVLVGVLHSTLYHYLLADEGNGKKKKKSIQ